MSPSPTTRIPYIDAMRGLAMLMVVMGHVMIFSFDHPDGNFVYFLVSMVELQLFFLVSGMCFRLPREWNVKSVSQFLGSKAFMLCVPASLFLGAYKYPNYGMDLIADPYKGGYWFTYTLFAFMLLYTFLHVGNSLCRIKGWRSDVFHILAALAVYAMATYGTKHFGEQMWTAIIGLQHFKFYGYFVLGMMAMKYTRGKYPRPTVKVENWLMGVIITTVLVMYIHTWTYGGNSYLPNIPLWFLTLQVLSVLTILFAIRRYPSFSTNAIGRVLQYMGRYTLDIYFIHYFLLTPRLSFVGDFFRAHPAPIIELCATLLLSSAIIAASLLVGKLIRISPITAHWLLGAKFPKTEC